MDPYYYEFKQELLMPTPITNIKAAPSGASQHQIIFNFSCIHRNLDWTIPQDSTELWFVGDVESPAVMKSARCDVPRINEHHKFKLSGAIFKALEDFPALTHLDRNELSQIALDSAWDTLAKSRPRHHYHHLSVDFKFIMVHEFVFNETRYINWISQQATEAAMVPATDTSIESLRSKTIEYSNEDHGSCVVCLEDFEAGSDSLVSMPCSHIFHGECIGKWLRTSHYCPVCRYEMPTN